MAAASSLGIADEPTEVPDDRQSIEPDDRVLLIVEDDDRFAPILLGLARERGFKGVVTARGDGVARAAVPADAITLDLRLPELDGWKVLDDLLKHDPATRHIPVHIISPRTSASARWSWSAIAHLTKPGRGRGARRGAGPLTSFAERKLRRLLVIEDDEVQRMAIVELIGNGDVETTGVAAGAEALAALAEQRYDCVVLDLGLPDMTGVALIERIRDATADSPVPIVIYTGKELTRARKPSCASWPRRSSSRTCARPSGCWTRRPCSCTALRLDSGRNGALSASCTAPTRSYGRQRC